VRLRTDRNPVVYPSGARRVTRKEWLELKSRVKITRGDNYLLIAFWVSVVITVVSQVVIVLGVIT
jgi:hypothetical protein